MLLGLIKLIPLITSRDAVIVKLPCDTTVKEHLNINHQALEIAIVTPENSTDLVAVLVACNIEKAQVGGTNVHKIPMVLYNNGALVPYDTNRPVHHALYVYKCGCDYKIVCDVYSKDFAKCRYYEVCYKYGKPTKEVKKDYCPPVEKPHVVPYCPPNPQPYCPPTEKCDIIVPYCPPEPYCPKPEIICPRPEPYCPPRGLCPYFSQNTTKCVATPFGKRYSKITTAKTFCYTPPCCLTVYGKADVKSQEVVDLRRRNNPGIPQILYDTRRMTFINEELSRRYPNELVCIYVDCHNCIYVKVCDILYKVYYRPGCELQTTRISEDELRRLTRKGLYGVEFGGC